MAEKAVLVKTYRYEGFNAGAAVKVGLIEAASEMDAGTKLREMGLFVNKIELHGDTPMKTTLPGAEEQADSLPAPQGTVLAPIGATASSRVSSPQGSHPKELIGEKVSDPPETESFQDTIRNAIQELNDKETWDKPAIDQLREGLADIGEFYRMCIGAQFGPFSNALAQDTLREQLNKAVAEMVLEEYKQAFGVYRGQEYQRKKGR